jgi:hypothetical protein
LHTNTLREITYTQTVTANEKGHYAALLPYANQGYSSAVEVDPRYSISCHFENGEFFVDEAAVVNGSAIEGPDICLGDST